MKKPFRKVCASVLLSLLLSTVHASAEPIPEQTKCQLSETGCVSVTLLAATKTQCKAKKRNCMSKAS